MHALYVLKPPCPHPFHRTHLPTARTAAPLHGPSRLPDCACPQRIVRLGGAVDDDMANLLVAQLLYLDSADEKRDITMYVNSPGGSVTAGRAAEQRSSSSS